MAEKALDSKAPGDLEDQGDLEPSLGWGNVSGQTGVGVEHWDCDSDGGGSGGGEGVLGFTGEGHDIGRELVRKVRQKRPEPSLKVIGPVVMVPGWHGPLSRPDPDQMDAKAHYWAAKGF